MKKLVLMRHGEAQPSSSNLKDEERPLTNKGQHDCDLKAQHLINLQVIPDLIIYSPAERTRHTSHIVADKLGKVKLHPDQNLYNAGKNFILNIVENCSDDIETLMIVAHNPGISWAFQELYLQATYFFQPSAIAVLTSEEHSWNLFQYNEIKLTGYFE